MQVTDKQTLKWAKVNAIAEPPELSFYISDQGRLTVSGLTPSTADRERSTALALQAVIDANPDLNGMSKRDIKQTLIDRGITVPKPSGAEGSTYAAATLSDKLYRRTQTPA